MRATISTRATIRPLLLPLALTACTDVVDRDVATLDATGLRTIEVRGIDGDLTVKGQEGRSEIEAIVRLKAWEEGDEDEDASLDTGRDTAEDWPDDGTAEPELDLEDQFEILLTNKGGGIAELTILTALDLSEYWVNAKIKVPSDMAVVASQIDEDITLRHVGGADLIDGGGSIDIRDATGDVTISDDGGSVRVRRVLGSVNIVDAGGRVVVKDVDGDVEIRDGKGGIKVRRVSGKVTIWDTQGAQSIKDVGETELHDPEG